MNGKTIYLENYLWYIELSDKKILDSAVIQNKKFEFKGRTDTSYMALISYDNRPSASLKCSMICNVCTFRKTNGKDGTLLQLIIAYCGRRVFGVQLQAAFVEAREGERTYSHF
jgi:hypothetical protein